jgi:toxin CptA
MSFAATIDLAPRPSMRALQILFVLHALPLALVVIALPPGLPLIGVAFAIGASWLWLRRHPAFGFGPRALSRLTWHDGGGWTLHDAAGAHAAQLLGDSLVRAPLLVLNFRLDRGGRRSRVLLGDELAPELLQRLRARLAAAPR